jgi:hypothetical protein
MEGVITKKLAVLIRPGFIPKQHLRRHRGHHISPKHYSSNFTVGRQILDSLGLDNSRMLSRYPLGPPSWSFDTLVLLSSIGKFRSSLEELSALAKGALGSLRSYTRNVAITTLRPCCLDRHYRSRMPEREGRQPSLATTWCIC